MDELIADTSLEDVGESCRPLVEMIGLENIIDHCGEYIGTDFSDEMIKQAGERFKSVGLLHGR